MKKILLSTLFLLSFIFYSHAQTIDVVGIGINLKTNENIPLSNVDNIDKMRVGAVIYGAYPTSSAVEFSDADETNPDFTFGNVPPILINNSILDPLFGGIYWSNFITADINGINVLISNSQKIYTRSFYAFVYRNIDTTYKSYESPETVYFFNEGSQNSYTYEIPINKAASARNITVKIPISELDDDTRGGVINITAGNVTKQYLPTTWNVSPGLENSFFLGTYLLENIPGDVDKVYVEIYSPTEDEALELGYTQTDSFFVSGVVVDVDIVDEDPGCTYTQGYWKNHSTCKKGNGNGPKRDDTWDDLPGGAAEETIFFLSDQDYCEVFETNSGKGGKYYILAHQYIAAQLNLLNGANPTDVADSFNEATTFLETYKPSDVKGNKSLEADCVRLGGILDDFNNGRIGPGHCDDNESETQVEQTKSKPKKEVSVYPNPANDLGKISFTAKQGGTSSVEMYNVNGRKVATLFSGKTKKDDEVVIEFDASAFKNGLYFTIIKNGTDIYKEKLSIVR